LVLKDYLKPLLARSIDTLILGCTHYGILEHQIRKLIPKNIILISEARIVPRKLKEYLERHPEIEKEIGIGRAITFYSTDVTQNFSTFGKKIFGKQIKVKRAELS